MKQNLAKFQGSSSISSAQFFGRETSQGNTDIEYYDNSVEDFKEGVKSFAGKLSEFANEVYNSIQVCSRIQSLFKSPALVLLLLYIYSLTFLESCTLNNHVP